MINLFISLCWNVNNKETDHQNRALWNNDLLDYPIVLKRVVESIIIS
jgi:hypothetical protein